MVGADGLAIDGAVHEGELAVLHVEAGAWIERCRFALSGARLGVRSRSGPSLRRPLPRADGRRHSRCSDAAVAVKRTHVAALTCSPQR